MTWKLWIAYAGWLLAASALALLFALLIGELVALAGLVEPLSDEQQRVVEIGSVVVFLVLALLPFLLRRRLIRSEEDAG